MRSSRDGKRCTVRISAVERCRIYRKYETQDDGEHGCREPQTNCHLRHVRQQLRSPLPRGLLRFVHDGEAGCVGLRPGHDTEIRDAVLWRSILDSWDAKLHSQTARFCMRYGVRLKTSQSDCEVLCPLQRSTRPKVLGYRQSNMFWVGLADRVLSVKSFVPNCEKLRHFWNVRGREKFKCNFWKHMFFRNSHSEILIWKRLKLKLRLSLIVQLISEKLLFVKGRTVSLL